MMLNGPTSPNTQPSSQTGHGCVGPTLGLRRIVENGILQQSDMFDHPRSPWSAHLHSLSVYLPFQVPSRRDDRRSRKELVDRRLLQPCRMLRAAERLCFCPLRMVLRCTHLPNGATLSVRPLHVLALTCGPTDSGKPILPHGRRRGTPACWRATHFSLDAFRFCAELGSLPRACQRPITAHLVSTQRANQLSVTPIASAHRTF
jgi:hypothetical protein